MNNEITADILNPMLNKCRACKSFFGSVIAWSYFPVATDANKPCMLTIMANWPKASGEYNREIKG